MKTYIIEHVHEPLYWNRELQDWRRDRKEATIYDESERMRDLDSEQGYSRLPFGGCWILVSEPNEAELQSAMATTSHLDDLRNQ